MKNFSKSGLLIYEPKAGQDVGDGEPIDPLEFLARVLIHIPEPNKHLVHVYGAYANRVRSSMPGRDSEQNNEQGEGGNHSGFSADASVRVETIADAVRIGR